MTAYPDNTATYRGNRYVLDKETIRTVDRHWGFVFEEGGYRMM